MHVESSYDYLDVQPDSGVNVSVGMYFTEETGTDKDPKLEYALADAPILPGIKMKSGVLTLKSGNLIIK